MGSATHRVDITLTEGMYWFRVLPTITWVKITYIKSIFETRMLLLEFGTLLLGGGMMSCLICVKCNTTTRVTILVCNPYIFKLACSNWIRFSPHDKITIVHDSTRQIWQTLSVQVKDLNQG